VAACGPSGPPTWNDQVADVVHGNCSQCHRPEGPAPFSLLTYEQAVDKARRIRKAVSTGHMPPWLPAETGIAFAGDRRLEEGERAALLAWVEAETPRGEGPEPSPPTFAGGWTLGEPDLVLEMRDTFDVPMEGHDHFRNFVLPVTVDRPRWVQAVELRPGNAKVVHHATMRVDDTRSSRLADRADPMPGFDEMFSRTEARPPGGFFLGWTPGRVVTPFPDGMAWRMEPGQDFIVQLHLRPTGHPERVSAQVGFWFTDEPPTRTPLIVRLGGQTMDIPPGEAAYPVRDSVTLPVGVWAIGAYPHAHYLGRRVRTWGVTPEGEEIVLMEIPEWDFNWQDAYRYADPVALPAGTQLKMEWIYDNTAENELNPFDPPRRVVYGPSSADEMAEFWLQVVPEEPAELGTLAAVLAEKDRRDKEQGFRFLLALDSTDAQSHFGLASLAQSAGDLEGAAAGYRRALRHRPDFAQAWYNLGVVQEEWGDGASAERSWQRAVEAMPGYPAALAALGRVRAEAGDAASGVALLEDAVAADSTDVDALNNLGGALREVGRLEESEVLLRRALRRDEGLAPAWFNLALTLAERGRTDEALEALNRGLALDGSAAGAALGVAWILVAHPDPEVRAPRVGGGLGEQLRAATGDTPAVLDLLATAWAATGDFDRAVALEDTALELARERRAAGSSTGVDEAELRARRALFARGEPYLLTRR
jgi:tetratricopeptide (TPR) repeat protein